MIAFVASESANSINNISVAVDFTKERCFNYFAQFCWKGNSYDIAIIVFPKTHPRRVGKSIVFSDQSIYTLSTVCRSINRIQSVESLRMMRKIVDIAKHNNYWNLASYTHQSSTLETERKRNLKDYFTKVHISHSNWSNHGSLIV